MVLICKPGKLNEDASNSILFYHSDAGGGADQKYRNTYIMAEENAIRKFSSVAWPEHRPRSLPVTKLRYLAKGKSGPLTPKIADIKKQKS